MAPVAHVSCAEAVPHSHGAAVAALPVYVRGTVLFAVTHACAISFELAVLAAQVLFFGVLFHAELLLAVDHASEVGLLAVVALEEGARVQGEAQQVALVGVAWRHQSLALVQALVLSHFKSELFDAFTELGEGGELLGDRSAAFNLYVLFAAGAGHEGEGDLEGIPSVLEKLQHAIGVEDMAAAESDAGLFAQLACVADRAQLVSRVQAWICRVLARWVEAG